MHYTQFLLVVAIAAAAAFKVNLNTQSSDLSDLILANVEALAAENKTNKSNQEESSKEITKYYYDSAGRLERTEKWQEYCCTSGKNYCSYKGC